MIHPSNWTAPGSKFRETAPEGAARRNHGFLLVLNTLFVSAAIHPCDPCSLWLKCDRVFDHGRHGSHGIEGFSHSHGVA